MKRSSNLRLTLMAAAIPAALTACEPQPPSGEVLTSVSDCDRVTDISPAECRAQYEKALAEHQKVAPRFQSAADCNDQFGQCTATTNERGETNWMPNMSGFLIGYLAADLLDGRDRRSSSGYSSTDCSRYPDAAGCSRSGTATGAYRTVRGSSPLYRDYRSGDYLKPSGDVASSKTGKVAGSYGDPTVPTRAITVSRSGFGSSSAARSSFGGGRSFGG